MRGAVTIALMGVLAIGAIAIARTAATVASSMPLHVMLIVEENRNESDVIGSTDAPNINSLANRYGLATSSFGQSHPSLPNYLALLSGSAQGVTDDGTQHSFDGPTLVDQLAQQGITWRAYMESMPSACYGGAASGEYAKKHDPFMYFRSITQNPAQCRNVVPFGSLQSDLSSPQAPDFIWITPNLCDDGHDCSTATADSWLATNLAPVLSSSWFRHDGVVIITWDEGSDNSGCCGGADGGHVGTLRTIEQLYGVPLLGDAACTCSGDLTSLIPAVQTAPTPAPSLTWLTVPHRR